MFSASSAYCAAHRSRALTIAIAGFVAADVEGKMVWPGVCWDAGGTEDVGKELEGEELEVCWGTRRAMPACRRAVRKCGSRASRSMCWDFVGDAGELCGDGWTEEGGGGGVVVDVDGDGDVDVAELRIEDVEGYCRRAAAPAALLATLEDWDPMVTPG